MAKKKAKKRKRTIPPGKCIRIPTKAGPRNVCRSKDGKKVRFKPLRYKTYSG